MHLLGTLGAPGDSFYCPTDPSLSHQHTRAKDSSSAKWDEGRAVPGSARQWRDTRGLGPHAMMLPIIGYQGGLKSITTMFWKIFPSMILIYDGWILPCSSPADSQSGFLFSHRPFYNAYYHTQEMKFSSFLAIKISLCVTQRSSFQQGPEAPQMCG